MKKLGDSHEVDPYSYLLTPGDSRRCRAHDNRIHHVTAPAVHLGRGT
jgi:hypothetical protein